MIEIWKVTLALGAVVLVGGCPASSTDTPDSGVPVEATFTSLYGDYFGNCKQCHAPGASGRTSDTEQTLNFTSRTTALAALKTGTASGLIGNFVDCNGVNFIDATPGKSLVLAVLDQPTRQVIDLSPAHATCDKDTIPDMTVKVGSAPSAAFLSALKTWITNGAPDN
jgi:hypothetical protein